jgi:hypothetical protein
MLRVALGRARPDTAWSNNVSDLQFNSGSKAATRSRRIISSILFGRQDADIESASETYPQNNHRDEPETTLNTIGPAS